MERGLITLDEPLDKHLPELAEQPIISSNVGEDRESNPFILTPAKNKVTLRHLLTHTSGVGYELFHPLLKAWRKSRGECFQSFAGNVAKACSIPLTFEPGTQWMYGGGHDWAGVLVSRLNGGITLEEYFSENIFKPLNMNSTTFHLEFKPHVEEKLIATMKRTEEGDLQLGKPMLPARVPGDIGGAGLYSSFNDYMEVLKDLIQDAPKLMHKETVDLMFTPQFEPGSGPHEYLRKNKTLYGSSSGGTVDDLEINYGLGATIYVKDNPQTGMPAKTLAWGGMPNLLWWMNRERGVACFFATQILPFHDKLCMDLAAEFQKGVWSLTAS